MAFKLSIPFYAFKLHFYPGGNVLKFLNDRNAVRLDRSLSFHGKEYAARIQEKISTNPDLLLLVDELHQGDFHKSQLSILIKTKSRQLAESNFEIELDYYSKKEKNGLWGIVPVLGAEAFARDEETLEKKLKKSIRLDFIKDQRHTSLQKLLPILWFDRIDLQQEAIDLKIPSPAERDQDEDDTQNPILPQLAHPIPKLQQVTFGRKNELDQFSKALKGWFFKNVLLVGPSGVGKTALVREIARQRKIRRIKGVFWETSPAQLIKGLVNPNGFWEENLSKLCKELSKSEDFLFAGNLRALFEMGKSAGNDISIAEYLSSYLSRGQLKLIVECTSEELAEVQLKHNDYLSYFSIIHLETPENDLEGIIYNKINLLAKAYQVLVTKEAIEEAIRLNQRFSPYAGMPGKPIRFLESLLLTRKTTSGGELSHGEVIAHFCHESGMPRFMVDPDIPMDYQELNSKFNDQLFGQDEAVKGVIDMLTTVKAALSKTNKPIASFLFVGPTGVGKTELAKILAGFMFGNSNKMERFDMSEYSGPDAVLRLIGDNYSGESGIINSSRKKRCK